MKSRLLAVVASLFGVASAAAQAAEPKAVEHAVIVRFEYGNPDWAPFFAYEAELEDAVVKSGLGDYDGNELAVDGSDGTLYMYGPSADKLFAFVRPLLERSDLLKNIEVTLRYGAVDDHSAKVVVVKLGT